MLRATVSLSRAAKPLARVATKAAPLIRMPVRAMSTESKPVCSVGKNISKLNGDQLFLYSSVALGICLPLSVLTAPTFLSVPFDTVVAVALPFHMATGVGHIVEDYTPAAYKVWAMRLVKLIAILVAYGLIKISFCGKGIGYSIKSLWLDAPKKKTPVA